MHERALPKYTRVVIIGGGVIGCSTAYHLTQMGCRDVLLLERHRLTAGTTWHSAGLMVTFGSTSETSTELRKYTRDLYARLEEETGQATGFRPIGFIEVAADRDRLEEYRRVSAFNRHLGVDVQEISPLEVRELFPLAKVDDLLAGFYVKEDGRVDPVDVTMALAKGAKMRGATFVEGVAVTGLLRRNGAVSGVRTPHGDVEAELVINCAGAWGRQLAEQEGVVVPLQAAEHYYLLTEPHDSISKSWPVLEDPGSHGYYREEGGGLMIGLFEPICAPWKVNGIPEDFAFGEIAPDWERMAPWIERAMQRVPLSLELGVKKLFCGPESFTPDMRPCLGESPELRNYFIAAGLNSIGILTGGGIGRVMAHWMLSGYPDVDVTGYQLDRFEPYQMNPQYRSTRAVESLGLVYQCHYPWRETASARGNRRSPLHNKLVEQGAHFRDVSGWEAADWFAGEGATPVPGPLGWGRPPWFSHWQKEHQAAREGVIVMDMSFMTKIHVEGAGAGRALDWLCTQRVDGDTGKITYTQWLNERGTLEADVTVTKLAEDRFMVTASDNARRHVLSWWRRHKPRDAAAVAVDVTSGYAQLNVQGPLSRSLLQQLTSVDVSHEAFPFRAVREVDIGYARVLVARITYLGELGYELYIPTEQAVHVYERIMDAGRKLGIVHAGLKALSSLRLEKAYRDYGHDIDNTDTPLEVGFGSFLALRKEGGFLGREAVLQQRARGLPHRQLLQILLEDSEPLLFHAEVVHRNGVAVGYIRSASYGFTLGGAVGLAMLEADQPLDEEWIEKGTFEVDVGGRRVPARVSRRPLYDPDNLRIRC
ncbi:MAG: GcvT family protein [Myxococcota bacterium]